jgi:pullulanase/glycogen debranching enzyme
MFKRPLLPLFLSIFTWLSAVAQNDSLLTGFSVAGDSTYFWFSEEKYGQTPPQAVVVTGSFRDWSQDMGDSEWKLRPGTNGVWKLAVFNPKFERIPPRAEFKFRINAGDWLQPPAGAPNEKGGNLVFLYKMSLPTLKAELRSTGAIWAVLEHAYRPIEASEWRLTDATGRVIPIAQVLPNTFSQNLLIPAEPIDHRRVYYLELPAQGLKAWCNYEGWWRDLYSEKELGANIAPDGQSTTFRVFASRAEGMKLYLYRQPEGDAPFRTIGMEVDEKGVWEAVIPENLEGVYYDFTVHGAPDPGNFFYETNPVHISDPYSRANVECWGRSRVCKKTTPAAPLKGGRPRMEDVIAYEVHVQDFTDLLPVAPELKGTIPAMTMPGLKNEQGEPIGFDYLVNLGINVVHLLPMQEFLHYKDDDWKASFADDPYMIEQGISEENYQWGYRTTHAFAVENRYRKKGTDYGAEREQFRDLVQAFHDKGIAVIIDIVPNHSGENMDGPDYYFHWNALDKVYHYRTKNLRHMGEYGNEIKTENRPMNQRWLLDQCKHFIEEFGIDGFRIDLAGQIDQQTLIKLRNDLGPDIIIYGEPWIGSADPDFEANPDWDWYKQDSPITFFQDDARNAFKGPVSNPYDKDRDRGYAGGNFREKEKVKLGLSCKFPEETSPLSGINYLDIHDNWALADQFATGNWDGRFGVDEDRYKIAAVLLYTSLGPIVTHGGSEMMRSKGLGPLMEVVKQTKGGTKVYIHGKRDTYNMRAANRFIWSNVGKTRRDRGSFCDYKGMYSIWQGLNRLRMSDYGAVFRQAQAVPDGYYRWVETENPYQLGYVVNDKVFVLINTGSLEHGWTNVYLPPGTWRLVGGPNGVDHVKGIKDKDNPSWNRLAGGASYNFMLQGPTFRIWVKD